MRDKPYCNAPWIGLSYEGTEGCKPCCEWKGPHFVGSYTDYIKSDYLKDFKALMYEDKMDDYCMECIHNEKYQYKISRRQKYELIERDQGLVRLDYRPGNQCNMKCRMCGPHASSLWEDEELEHNKSDAIFNNVRPNGVTEVIPVQQELGYQDYDIDIRGILKIDTSDVYDIDLSNVHKIMILGGEPSIDLEVRKFIDYIADLNLDCYVGISTNGTNASNKWFNSLKRIKKLELVLSIDGTGAVQDYQRKGGEWSKIKENLIKYRDTFRNVTINLTATAINFPVLDLWWDELMNMGIRVFIGKVHFPIYFNIDAIPKYHRDYQIAWLKKWKPTEKWHAATVREAIIMLETAKYNANHHKQFIERTLLLDGRRNETILDLDERFEDIMNEG
jgi:MoaA/NifB/PqqE/SkfB family radical SAM enzyme